VDAKIAILTKIQGLKVDDVLLGILHTSNFINLVSFIKTLSRVR